MVIKLYESLYLSQFTHFFSLLRIPLLRNFFCICSIDHHMPKGTYEQTGFEVLLLPYIHDDVLFHWL